MAKRLQIPGWVVAVIISCAWIGAWAWASFANSNESKIEKTMPASVYVVERYLAGEEIPVSEAWWLHMNSYDVRMKVEQVVAPGLGKDPQRIMLELEESVVLHRSPNQLE